MTINPSDVTLYESQRLTDTDDGGGRATGNVIVDGNINNLFPDISRLDRTIGDVALRKAFVGVATSNAETYLGAHAILTRKPVDPKVSVVLFNTESESDERLQARNRIESYVVRGARADWYLLGTQYSGQRLLIGFQDLTRDQPEVGEVFELVDDANSQFVRLTSVEGAEETFIEEQGNVVRYLERRKLTLGISAPLESNFSGGTPSLGGTSEPASLVHTTEVADAARYYGVTETTAVAAQGDLAITVDSIFAPLVPSAQKESVWLDQPGGYVRQLLTPAGGATRSESAVISYISKLATFYTHRPITPGSLVISISTLGGGVYTDNGDGSASHSSGGDSHTITIDYAAGQVRAVVNANFSGSGSITVDYLPAATFIGQAESGYVAVTAGNRSFSWTLNLADSKPRPGTLVIYYLAQGKWQLLEDSGAGELRGQGSGNITFTTGSVAMTFPVMPDVGSAIVYAYIADVAEELTQHSGAIAHKPQVLLALGECIKPGSVSCAWSAGGAKTATDDGAGNMSGDAVGLINYATGEVTLEATGTFLAAATELTVDFDNDTNELESVSMAPDSNGVVSGTLANAPILAGSLSIDATCKQRRLHARTGRIQGNDYTQDVSVRRLVSDDGAGGFRYDDTGAVCPGAIDYVTGAYTLEIEREYNHEFVVGTGAGRWGYGTATVYGTQTTREAITGATNIRYQQAGASHATQQQVRDAASCVLKLLAEPGRVVPGSVLFAFGGTDHVDIDGLIVTEPSHATGAGTAVGRIDYTTGEVSLDSWPADQTSTAVIEALLTQDTSVATSVVKFRTPGKPLRPGSLQLTAVREDTGALITATAAADGRISHAALSGSVDVDSGLVDLWFTSDDTDNSGASDIPIYPGSLRYNAVSYSYLPMDAALIGVDPVRLPGDGRVPIVRDGDVMVLAHTAETDIGTPVADDVETLARSHQAEIEVLDSAGVALDPNQYVVDLEAGSVAFANPLILEDIAGNALTPPLTVHDRIEHMSVVSDTQISGELAMIAPLAHDYPAGSTFSSALLWGDIAARALNVFTQKTWNSSDPNWTDQRDGDDTTASFNLIDNPVAVNNNGAITEKWALVFTGTANFQIVGEQVGIIGAGTISADAAPLNPNTGNPYFSVAADGWGSGWVSGNVLRFDTAGCLAPMWLARTVVSGQGTVEDDSVTLQIRGDAD